MMMQLMPQSLRRPEVRVCIGRLAVYLALYLLVFHSYLSEAVSAIIANWGAPYLVVGETFPVGKTLAMLRWFVLVYLIYLPLTTYLLARFSFPKYRFPLWLFDGLLVYLSLVMEWALYG